MMSMVRYLHAVRAIHPLSGFAVQPYGDTDDVIAPSDGRGRSCLGVQGGDGRSAGRRREPRVYDGRLACATAAEGQLAMGEDGGEGVGAHDRRWRSTPGFQLTAVARTYGF